MEPVVGMDRMSRDVWHCSRQSRADTHLCHARSPPVSQRQAVPRTEPRQEAVPPESLPQPGPVGQLGRMVSLQLPARSDVTPTLVRAEEGEAGGDGGEQPVRRSRPGGPAL